MKKILKLFLIFLKIGVFTFGGGYAMIPLIEDEIVKKNNWVKEEEFLDIIAFAQSIPGALAINSATYVGYRTYGFWGAIAACLGAALPSFFIIFIIAKYLTNSIEKDLLEKIFKGIRPAVVSLILASIFKLKKGVRKNMFSYVILLATVALVIVFKVNPIFIIVISGALGYFLYKEVG